MMVLTGESPSKPVYGYPLEEHLRVTGRKVAFPIELCVCALLELGMEEEGLFRVAGGRDVVLAEMHVVMIFSYLGTCPCACIFIFLVVMCEQF
jgi:hypothetical protein